MNKYEISESLIIFHNDQFSHNTLCIFPLSLFLGGAYSLEAPGMLVLAVLVFKRWFLIMPKTSFLAFDFFKTNFCVLA